MNFLSKQIRWVIPLLLLVSILAIRIFFPTKVEEFQLKIFDTFQEIKPRPYEDAPVLIIDVDEETLSKIGQWPWPRTQMAKMVKHLSEAGASVIAFDVLFAEPDRTSPKNVLAIWPKSAAVTRLKTELQRMPDHDQVLANSMKKAKVIAGFNLGSQKNAARPAEKSSFAFAGDDPADYLPQFQGATPNLPEVEQAVSGNGSFNFLAERDGIIRRVSLVFRLADKLYPSLALEALRVFQGAKTHLIKSVGGSGETTSGSHTGMVSLKTGHYVIPTDEQGRLWLYDTGYERSRFLPAWQVLDGTFEASKVKDKIVLIGSSAAGLKDVRATPLNPVAAGTEIQAQILEQILLGRFLQRPDWAPGAEFLYILILGLVLIFIMGRVGAAWSAVLGILTTIAAFGASWFFFVKLHWLLDPVLPFLATLLIYLSSSLLHYLKTESEKRTIRNAFTRYLSPTLVEKVADSSASLKLGGEIKEMSFLFSDIRGFTTIAENFAAEELTEFMNGYLTPMTDIILNQKGTIDKYMGDSIMAFWNAPLEDPQYQANTCRAALEMRHHLKEWNQKMAEEAQKKGKHHPVIQIGIGLNAGKGCVGNMGSDQRFEYSVLGDDVNVAARLESLSKQFGLDILLGENIVKAVPDLVFLEVDLIKVKGKNKPVHIYTLLGGSPVKEEGAMVKLIENNQKMLECYRSQKWEKAQDHARTCMEINAMEGMLGEFYRVYLSRIAEHLKHPPDPNWDGVTVAMTK